MDQQFKLLRDCDGVLSFREFLVATHETVSHTTVVLSTNLREVSQFTHYFEPAYKQCATSRRFVDLAPVQATGSPQQKLRWQFRLYDKDGSGSVELKEMVEILVMILQNDYSR